MKKDLVKNEKLEHKNRLPNGKFAPGNCANPNGRPKNADVELLRQALYKEGEKRGVTFWDQVAKYAFHDRNVMIALLKKFVPDKIEGTGFENNIMAFFQNIQVIEGRPLEEIVNEINTRLSSQFTKKR